MNELIETLKRERVAHYARVRGGYPVPLAGMIYWLALGIAGYYLPLGDWLALAFPTSGLIFPLALLLSWGLRAPFMKDKGAVQSLLFPGFLGMLLFWPMAFATTWTAPVVAPLVLAIGMSMHWPVLGWIYGRTTLFSAHAVVRAVACFYIWVAHPEQTLTLLPFAVAATYAVTVLAILIDVALIRRKAASAGALQAA